MATADPYQSLLDKSNQVRTVSQAPSTTQQSSSSAASGQQSNSSFTEENVSLLSTENQKALDTLIQQLLGGGTPGQQKNNKERDLVMTMVQDLLQQYSKQQAFQDASGLMALNLKKSFQSNAPAIAKSIEGAGTSASAMQGLLAQNLANDSALAASALGGEQAKAYGNIQTNLGSLLENLSRPDNTIINALTNALGTAKGANVNRTVSQVGDSTSSQVQSGQATTLVNGGYQGGQAAQTSQNSVGGQTAWDPLTSTPLDNAAAAGYDGRISGEYSPGNWNQISGSNWFTT